MRTRLLEATVESLAELGGAKTTTIEVSPRAGVSRGAQLHHFLNRKELVFVAIRHLAAKRRHELAAQLSQAAEPKQVRDVLEILPL